MPIRSLPILLSAVALGFSAQAVAKDAPTSANQTIAVPGKPLRPGAVVSPFPPINLTGFSRSTTGYPVYKFLEYDNGPATQDGNFSSAPLILFRYAEVLLNYAEAVAELIVAAAP